MAFSSEPEPLRRRATPVAAGVRRIVAPNPGIMTYHGTNTYLIDGPAGTVVLDPGPEDAGHLADILRETDGRVAAILVSHTHADHLGSTEALKAWTGAPTYASHLTADPSFVPDILVRHGDDVAGMTALHTPGHASDHLCFSRPDGVLFSADHVMSWSSSIVSPPGGNMADYFDSLRLVLAREDRLLLPGHGPPVTQPGQFVQALLAARVNREIAIARAILEKPYTPAQLVHDLYSKTEPALIRAAERNVIAHLIKLEAEGKVRQAGELWIAA